MVDISLDTLLSDCPVVHGSEAAALSSLTVNTVGDLLKRPPRRHEDRRRFDSIAAQEEGHPLCLRVKVVDTQWKHQGPGRRYFEALAEETTNSLRNRISCRWFHFPAISRMIVTGMELILYGKVKMYGKTLTMVHPEFEVVDTLRDSASLHLERIVPVYGRTAGLNQRNYRELVGRVLSLWAEEGRNEESPGLASEKNITYPLKQAFGDLHFPETKEDAARARRYFSFEECVYLQLSVVWRRRRMQGKPGQATAKTSHLVRDLCDSLPFELTASQKESVREIYRDMKRPVPMNRLLQGDVGSGKTLVSICAMLMAVESGYQAALMAPTQILAEQHFKTCRRLLEPLGVKVLLLTGSKEEESPGWGGRDEACIVIGTHALLYRKNMFRNLGLVVIDEQHKFGVDQRERLISQGNSPDVLVMTATPIPRTLTLTLYGDLDVSLLEKPPGRGRVVTALRTEKSLSKVVKFVREQVDEGRQVYVVSPLVEEGTGEKKRQGKSAVSEYDVWKSLLPLVDIGLLHGRMGAEEKESVMQDFRKNKYSVLIATTVIEVGVDVPNATIMIINNADQFGLSQLHQLRGRVGRGEQKSWCILLASKKMTEEGQEKLELFEKISDGFELSEADFRLRGPGDIFGTAQSGLSDVRFPEWLYDTRLIATARKKAEQILDSDPDLSQPEHLFLRDKVTEEDGTVNN